MKFTNSEYQGCECVLCGSTVAVEPMQFTSDALELYCKQFSQTPEEARRTVGKIGVCARCRSLSHDERRALSRMALVNQCTSMGMGMGMTREQALATFQRAPKHLLPEGF